MSTVTETVDSEKVKRTDLLHVDPSTIKDAANLARPSGFIDGEIDELVESIRRNGQLEPGTCLRDKKTKELTVLFGHKRFAAIMRLYEENPAWKFKCFVANMNAKDAFFAAVDENRVRSNPNPIDDSYNMCKMFDDFGMTPKRIAEYYKCSESQVSMYRRLKPLSHEIQQRVKLGELSVADALELGNLTPEIQAEVLDAHPAAPLPPVIIVDETLPESNGIASADLEDWTKPDPEPEPEVTTDPVDEPSDTNESGLPTKPIKAPKAPKAPKPPKVVKVKTEEERAAAKAKTDRQYANMQKKNKQAIAGAVKQKKKDAGETVVRSLKELKAVLKGREDKTSKTFLEFIMGELNSPDLDAYLNTLDEDLQEFAKLTGCPK